MQGKFLSLEFMQKALQSTLENQKCADLHEESCNMKSLKQFKMGCLGVYKMYLLVHLIPFLLFKRKKVAKEPVKQIKKLLLGFIKSLLFAGGYSMLVRRFICLFTQYRSYNYVNAFFSGLFAGITLIFEPLGRQSEISMYCLNKSIEVAYNMAIRRNYPVRIPLGECLVNAVAIAILTYVYMSDSSVFRDNYKKALDQLLQNI